MAKKNVNGKAFAELTKRTASAFARKEIDDIDVKKDYAQEVIDANKVGDTKKALEAGAKRAVKIAENPKEFAKYINPPKANTFSVPQSRKGANQTKTDTTEKKDLEDRIKQAEEKSKRLQYAVSPYNYGSYEKSQAANKELADLKDEYERKYNSAAYFDRKAHQPGKSEARQADKLIAQYLPYLDTLNKNKQYYAQNQNERFKLADGSVKTGAELFKETSAEYERVNSEVQKIRDTGEYYKNLTPEQQTALKNARLYEQQEKRKKDRIKKLTEKYGYDENFDLDDLQKWAKENGFMIAPNSSMELFVTPKRYRYEGYAEPTKQQKEDAKELTIIAKQNTIKNDIANSKTAATLYNIGNSTVGAVGRGIAGAVGTAEDAVRVATGHGVNMHSAAKNPQYFDEAIKEATQENYSSKWFGGKEVAGIGNLGNFAYNLATGVVENATLAAVSAATAGALGLSGAAAQGFASGMTSTLMGSDVAQRKIIDEKRNGANDVQALVKGIAAGTIEWITEKYSIDKILDEISKNGTNIFKVALKSFIAESSEEVASNWLNRAVDSMLKPGKDDLSMQYYTYISKGATPKEALTEVMKGIFSEDFQAGLAGGLSGIAMGGAFRGVQSVQDMRAGKYIAKKGAVNSLISQALNMPENTRSNLTAQKMAQEIKEGKEPTYKRTGELLKSFIEEGGRFVMPENETVYDKNKAPKGFLAAVDKKLVDFVEMVKKNPTDNKSFYSIGRVSNRLSSDIKNLTGIDTKDFAHRVKANSITHILNRHGENGNVDHSLADTEDIARMGYVLENYEDIEVLEDSSREYRDKNQRPAPMVRIYKKVDGTYYVVEAVPDTNAKRLEIVTAYIDKNSKATDAGYESPLLHAQDASADNGVSNTTVTQNESGVNTYDMQNEKNNAGILKNEASERFRTVRPKFYTVLDGIGKRLNTKIVIDEELEGADGYFDRETRELHINANAQNPIKEVIKHEITHILEGTKEYDELVSFMREHFAKEWSEKENAVKELYESINKSRELLGEEKEELTPKRLSNEVMAELSEKFNSDEFLERVSRENPTMIDKIKDFIKDVIARLKGVVSQEELKRWQEAEKKWENAFLNADTTARDGGKAYLFVGQNAKGAETSLLQQAKQMQSDGVTKEEILQKTGWFVGADGKWRFEINDRDMELIEEPNLVYHHIEGDGPGEYYQTAKLADILKHNKLFEEYPQLKNYTVIIQETNAGEYGMHFGKAKQIVLSRELFKRYTKEYKDFLDGGRKEEINRIEQTPEYKEYSKFYDDAKFKDIEPTEWLKLEKEARDKFYSSELGKRYYELNWGKTPADITKFEEGWTDKAKEVLIHEVQHAIQDIEGFAGGSSDAYWKGKGYSDREANKLYYNSAGEIEARDVSDRLSLTDEQRRNNVPESAKENSDRVFAEGNIVSYSYGVTQDDIDKYVDNAWNNKGNSLSYKKYAKASERLINDIKQDVDINGYSHALRDNDIRHIKNSHGETTKEKYPVTPDDIKDIPYIVENYDKVYFNARKGKNSLIYVKASLENTLYFVEQATEQYGNEKLLVNKQMIKTGIDDIPNIYLEAINKKEGITKFLADLKQIRKEYAQSVVDYPSIDPTISQNESGVNTYNTQNSKNNAQKEFKFQDPGDIDAEYGSYVAAVEAENAEIKELNESLKREIMSKRTLSTNPARINEVVARIKKDYKSSVNLKETAGAVQEVWERIVALSNTSPKWFAEEYPKEFYKLAKIGANIAWNTTEVDRTLYDQYKDLREHIRNTAISISKQDASSIPDFNTFRKRNFGRIKISQNTTFGVDSFYQELCEMYPEFFTDDITHPADQLLKISEVLDYLKPRIVTDTMRGFKNMYGIDFDDAGNAIAAEIINTLQRDNPYDAQTTTEYLKKSFVKDYKDKYDRLKKEYGQRLENYREERKEREAREKLLDLARYFQKLRTTPENLEKIPETVKELDTMGISLLEKGTKDEDGNVTRYGKLELKELRDKYLEALKNGGEPNKFIEEKINRLDRKQIGDLDISDVYDLITTLQAARKAIWEQNRLIRDTKRREVYKTAQEVIKEVRNVKNPPKEHIGYQRYMLSPLRMARRMVNYAKNSTFVELFDKLNEGNHKRMEFLQQTAIKFLSISQQKEELEKVSGKNATVKTYRMGGTEFKLTPAMRIALYLHAQCEANMNHIKYGGIYIPDIKLYNEGDFANAYSEAHGAKIVKLTKQDIEYITRDMTAFERQIAETASKWLNEDCKKAINETSLDLLGYEVARVGKYMPIKTSDNFTKSEPLIVDGTLEGQGMLKERQNGVNAIKLVDIIRVIDMQKEGVARYYGLAIPLRNFNAVYNSMSKGMEDSVKAAIDSVWGGKYNGYIDDMLADLQSGRKSDDDFSKMLRKYRGNYAQAVLSMNLPVTIKQAASYPTAAAVIGWKPLIEAMGERLTDEEKEIIHKYTPLLWYRMQGYSMQEIGDFVTGKDGLSKRLPLVMGTIQKVDVATTIKLWKAAEIYVRNQGKFEKGSHEYYKEVAKVYNEVIEKTQPNYEVMQRPGVLRSPNEVVKSLAMFATQRFQNYNILSEAMSELKAAEDFEITEEMLNNEVIKRADKKWIEAFKEYEANKVKEQIDAWDKNGRNRDVFFNFGQPSELLRNYGISGAYIQLDASKVLKILNEHIEMDLNVIKELGSIISDPVLILKSKAQNVGKSFVLYGEVTGKNGKPVMVSIRTNMTGGVNSIQDVSKITSAYTRRNTQNFIDSSDVLWVTPDKKRASGWMYSFGLQLPSATSNANSFNSTIPQDKSGVNTYDMQNLKNNKEFIKFVRQNFKEEWKNKRVEVIKSFKAENEEWVKEARWKAFDAVTSQIVANVVIAAMNYAGALFLHRTDKWKDEEEDKYTFGSVARGVVDDFLSSFFGIFWGGSEAYQILKSLKGGEKWYDITMPATDILNGIAKQAVEFGNIMSDHDRRFHIKEYIKPTTRFAESAFQALGIPAKNAGKLVNSAFEYSLDALEKFGIEQYSTRYWKMKITTPESKKAQYGKFLQSVAEAALAEENPKKREDILSQFEYISEDMKRYMDTDYVLSKEKLAFKKYISRAIAEASAEPDEKKRAELFDKVNMLNKEAIRFIGVKEADAVKKDAIKNAGTTSSADKYAEELEKTKPEEVYEADYEKDGTRYITYDGEKHKLTVEQEIKYLQMIDDYTGGLYDKIIGNGEDISTALMGSEKHTTKTTKTEEKRVYDYFYRKYENGEITEAQLKSNYDKYLSGELEVPILKVYMQGQDLTYSQLTYSQRKDVIETEEKKVKKGEISQADFEKWKKGFESGNITVSKSLQIIDRYSDYDKETQHKVLGKIRSIADKKAQEDMRGEVLGE